MQEYYSSGKFLLSAEYAVLFGAKALAVPVKYGQEMKVSRHPNQDRINWVAREKGVHWFEALFTLDLELLHTDNKKLALNLKEILEHVKEINPGIFQIGGYTFYTDTDFPRNWGLGTSSTLLLNLSKWSEIDPFRLHDRISNGSGYDIAIGIENCSILFQRGKDKRDICKVDFNPEFRENLFFVYQGNKADSSSSVTNFLKEKQINQKQISYISELTRDLLNASDLRSFNKVIHEHEFFLGQILRLDPLKKTHYADYPGEVKSLGAWGGDFAMFSGTLTKEQLLDYLRPKGLNTVFKFNEIILNTGIDNN